MGSCLGFREDTDAWKRQEEAIFLEIERENEK